LIGRAFGQICQLAHHQHEIASRKRLRELAVELGRKNPRSILLARIRRHR
jgi:hypothetical protein